MRWVVLTCALVFLYVYPFPYFEKIHSANELPRLYQTMAIVDQGVLQIDEGVRRFGPTADLARYGGHTYSNKPPGMSLLGVPFYWLLKQFVASPSLVTIMRVLRLGCAVLPALAFLFFGVPRLLSLFVESTESRQATVLIYGTGSMALTYGTLLLAHQTAAVCVGFAYLLLAWVRQKTNAVRVAPVMAGVAAGVAVVLDYQAAFAVLLLCLYAFFAIKPKTVGVAFVLGGIPFAIALGAYHHHCFGHVLSTGYQNAATPWMHKAHAQGFLGLTVPHASSLVRQFFSLRQGLFTLAPVWAVALFGIIPLLRKRNFRADGVLALATIALYTFVSTSLVFAGGWSVGPRYLTVLLVFLIVPLALTLEMARPRPWLWSLVAGTAVVSIVIYTLSTAVFPHFPPAFHNPFCELILRLVREGRAPHTLGELGLLPHFVVVILVVIVFVVLVGSRRLAVAGALLLAAGYFTSMSLQTKPSKNAERTYQWVRSIWEP